MQTISNWQKKGADIFWGEIAPCDHVVQIYENDGVFLDALAGFVGSGINSGDCCIVIATQVHLNALEYRLTSYGVRMDTLLADNRYIPLVAEDTLAKFMRNGWPDETLFLETLDTLFKLARRDSRNVRAFGEMVAILWAQGHHGATVHLEHLWNKYCEQQPFCLFCAYPKSGFTDDMNTSLNHICNSHSKMIAGNAMQLTEVIYTEIEKRQAV